MVENINVPTESCDLFLVIEIKLNPFLDPHLDWSNRFPVAPIFGNIIYCFDSIGMNYISPNI